MRGAYFTNKNKSRRTLAAWGPLIKPYLIVRLLWIVDREYNTGARLSKI
jgi:hypothetical protein